MHYISERRRAERLLRAQHAITRVFAQAQTSHEAMGGLLAALGEAMDWQLGAWWSREEGTEVLRCRAVRASEAAAAEFEQVSLELELARGVALPGRVWTSGQARGRPTWRVRQSCARAGGGARRAARVVVCTGHRQREFYAAVEFFSAQVGEPDLATLPAAGHDRPTARELSEDLCRHERTGASCLRETTA